MKLVALGLLAVGVVWWLHRHGPADRMSRAWLDQQYREGRLGERAGIDGVCWLWPIDKREDERGWRNRERLRKRA